MRRRIPPSLLRFARFITAGGFVAIVNLGMGALLLALGVEVQLAVAIAYLAGITAHFTLQRLFVFAGEGTFALTLGRQLRRYAALAAVQYPATAGLVALVTAAGLSNFEAVVCAALLVMPLTYILLRTQMFHVAAGDQPQRGSTAA